jgi:hypothetical protein
VYVGGQLVVVAVESFVVVRVHAGGHFVVVVVVYVVIVLVDNGGHVVRVVNIVEVVTRILEIVVMSVLKLEVPCEVVVVRIAVVVDSDVSSKLEVVICVLAIVEGGLVSLIGVVTGVETS